MPIINVETAYKLINQTNVYCTQNKWTSPFFYLVGAGISTPSIPLTSDMLKEFARTINESYSESDNIQELYSEFFQQAYPERVQRRQYLADIMEKAAINDANFMLAHLLQKKHKDFANLVVTTNFDDLLSKALMLFGENPLIFDYPNSIERIITSDQHKIKIVHVHGSYRFYDCKNLSSELVPKSESDEILYDIVSFANKSKKIEVNNLVEDFKKSYPVKNYNQQNSIFNYLMELLYNSCPLIIGYSGWNDVVMQALKQRLTSTPGYHYYWFCYDGNALKTLDPIIQNSEDVYIVVNDTSLEGIIDAKEYLENKDFLNNIDLLPATKVFEKLKIMLNTEDLDLFKDPIKFFSKRLRKIFPRSAGTNKVVGIETFYKFDEVLEKLQRAVEISSQATLTSNIEPQNIDKTINQIYSLGRTSKLVEALKLIEQNIVDNNEYKSITYSQKNDLLNIIYLISERISKDEEFKEADKTFSKLIKLKEENNNLLREVASQAWHEHAKLLYTQKKVDASITSHLQHIKEFEKDESVTIRENVARSYFTLGHIYTHQSELTKANDSFQNMIDRFKSTESKNLKIMLANCYYLLANNFHSLTRDHDRNRNYTKASETIIQAEFNIKTLFDEYGKETSLVFKKILEKTAALKNVVKSLKSKLDQ